MVNLLIFGIGKHIINYERGDAKENVVNTLVKF